MRWDTAILHSDLNSFYASVEALYDPYLRGKAVAVCGAIEERHGIVLAKSERAKKAGIKTGMTNGEAKKLCPELIIVHPNFDRYLKYSRLSRDIYLRYTDRVEPFGMDEAWCDVTGCCEVAGDGAYAAELIRRTVHDELGLTVSVGVSFNKVFAKLGSDMKKPDATTVITRENFREKVWPLPASDLLYAGRATVRKLSMYGINTIGDIACASDEFLKRLLGVAGVMLWTFAGGLDTSRVMHMNYEVPVKSISHGVTCAQDLANFREVRGIILELSQDIGHKLRANGFAANGVQIAVRDASLFTRQYQTRLAVPTQSPAEITETAAGLFEGNYRWACDVRAVTVRAWALSDASQPRQTYIFDDIEARCRRERLDTAIDDICRRFGRHGIYPAAIMENAKIRGCGECNPGMPGMMYR